MKILVVDNESDVRGSYRRLLREVSAGPDDTDPNDPFYPNDGTRPASHPVRLNTRHGHHTPAAHPASALYEQPLSSDNGYAQSEGHEHPPHSPFGSEHMTSFAQTSDAQFAAVEDAVLQTPRGRWFLAEYLRRNRGSETERVLAAIESLKAHVLMTRDSTVVTALRRELQDIAVTIVHARRDIAALKLDPAGPSIAPTSDELDTVVAASERATGDILSSVERLQDVALRLRSKGVEPAEAEAIEAQAITILRACSSQDITGQRVSRIVSALRIVEQRVAAALDAILTSEGDRTKTTRPGASFERQPAQRPDISSDISWVTPAADRIIRTETTNEAPFEHSVARAY